MLLDVAAALEHAGALGGDVGIVGERVPRAEHDVVERGERHEVLDHRACGRRCACRGGWCPSAPASRSVRRGRACTSSTPAMSVDDDGAEADDEHAEASVGRVRRWGRGRSHGARLRHGIAAELMARTRHWCPDRLRVGAAATSRLRRVPAVMMPGKPVADAVFADLAGRIDALRAAGHNPTLGTILVGTDCGVGRLHPHQAGARGRARLRQRPRAARRRRHAGRRRGRGAGDERGRRASTPC